MQDTYVRASRNVLASPGCGRQMVQSRPVAVPIIFLSGLLDAIRQ